MLEGTIFGVARARDVHRVSIETGTMAAFAPARAPDERAGFAPCEPFGSYAYSPNSICMTLRLDGDAPSS
jgi:putative acetyltransferase